MRPGLYPENLPPEILNDPNRDSEVKTFNALKKGMPPDYHIFYSCDWLDTRGNPIPSRDGECDFIIAHPDLGILFIEVKGGELGRDGITGEWYRHTSYGRKKIKDPVKQARTSKHVTLQLLKDHWPKGKIPYLRLRHGVILPHSSKPKTLDYLGAHMPLSIFAFAEDMENLSATIIMMLLEKEGELENNYGQLGQAGINLLHKFFASSFDFTPALSSSLDAYDERISQNTDEQSKFLEFTRLQSRALVFGGAGTGKTYLALQKTIEFSNKGFKTLLLYYNAPMAKYAKQKLKNLNDLSVKTFHELCHDAADTLNLNLELSDKSNLFDTVLPLALEQALSLEKAALFDAIIIDEAQDLKETWVETLLLCLKDLTKGKIFVFADDNQNLYENISDFPKILECAPMLLTKNVRNTDKIFSYSQNFYSGITTTSCSFNGPEVRFESLKEVRQGKELVKFLSRLRDVDGVPWEKIAVLSMRSREESIFFIDLRDISQRADDFKQNGKIVFDSVWRFKGLEKQVIIIVDIDSQTDNQALQYVAITRARTLLIFAGPKTIAPRFAKLLLG